MKATVYGKYMKNVTIKNAKEYDALWLSVERSKALFTLWQVESEGSRRIKSFRFNVRKVDKNEMSLLEQEAQKDRFSLDDIYGYCEELGFIFKTQVSAIVAQEIILSSPLVIKILEEDDVQFIKGLTGVDYSHAPWRVKKLDSNVEEEVYTSLREAPRARPKGDKRVSLYKTGVKEEREEFVLFDISRGGLSFLTSKEEQFQKGDYLEIAALEEELDPLLIGEVMSIRMHDEFWKVGIKFIDKIPAQED